jgi:uncharacterized protein (TIGR03000 family)
MYSLVLMAAMSSGAAATPAWHGGEVDSRGTNFIHATAHEHYRHGCHGCYGGGCYGGCYGGCHGCYGGWSCCGCCGGGWSCGGCYGGGCYGGGWSCGGCYGGGCYGGGCYGGRGGYASYSMPYGSYAGMPAYGGYSSGYYSPAVPDSGFSAPAAPAGAAPAGTRGTEEGGRDQGKSRDEGKSRESLAPAPARLIITLPADAKLMIDDYVARSTAGTRTFVSPPLERGQAYHYTLKAELRRGDEPVTVTREATVRAGQETHVTLDFAGKSVAQK